MGNKGLTLVELIATLIVLSVVALIVTPNIYDNIRDYKNKVYSDQLDNIKQAGKNWTADHIEDVEEDMVLMIPLKELQDNGYISEKIVNPNGGNFTNEAFVLVKCEVVHDDEKLYNDNYKYTYGAYENMAEYKKSAAIEYAKDNIKEADSIEVSIKKLIEKKYLESEIKKYGESQTLKIQATDDTIVVTQNIVDGEYVYKAAIQ